MNARSTDFGTIIYRFQIAFNAWMNSINTGRDWTQRNALTCPKGSTSSWESRKISYDIKPIVPNIEIVIEKKRAEGTYNIFHLFISKYNCAKLIFSTFWMINSVKVCNQSFGLARRWNRLIRDPIDFFSKFFFGQSNNIFKFSMKIKMLTNCFCYWLDYLKDEILKTCDW